MPGAPPPRSDCAGALLALSLLSVAAAAGQPPTFRLVTEEAGVHRVEFADLFADPSRAPQLASADLALTSGGRLVELWLEDGGDGRFGPGDWLEFVATRLPGEGAYTHEYAPGNVYWLLLDPARARRFVTEAAPPRGLAAARLERHLHLERDELMIRVGAADAGPSEAVDVWHWAKLSHLAAEPFVVPLPMTGVDAASPEAIRVEVELRGLSSQLRPPGGPPPANPDHHVTALLRGMVQSAASWDGRTSRRIALRWPAAAMPAGETALELRVPRREVGPREPLVDVVMLNWVEARYPHTGALDERPVELHLAATTPEGLVTLRPSRPGRLIVYTRAGRRLALDPPYRFPVEPRDGPFWVLPPGHRPPAPARIAMDAPSSWSGVDRQADYLMIAPAHLLAAAEELAAFHRSRGLTVAVADIQDVYDEFGHGIPHPRAVRAFITHAYFNWRRPAPRFVLLVGDASWDTKHDTVDLAAYAEWADRAPARGEAFPVKPGPVYEDGAERNARNLIPSWSYRSEQGHSASDNWYVAVDGDDPYPDLAIGRLPVITPEEVRAIARKIERYTARPPLGPWRASVLWISNEMQSFQERSDRLAAELGSRGFASRKIYPGALPVAEHQRELESALDDGQLLVHFVGHGGRYVWQTGPPSRDRPTELFGVDRLAELAASERLPVILSLTCHTGPFDHPNADSIGEAFLRLPDRGAAAVIAASWRNDPSEELSAALLAELTVPGTLGEALLRAKRRLADRELIELYNLLGDPATPLAVPPANVELTAAGAAVRVRLPAAAAGGRLVATWWADAGEVLRREEIAVAGTELELALPDGIPAAGVAVYFWNEATAADGRGGLRLAGGGTGDRRLTAAAISGSIP